jgi:hypothetical protein
MRPPGPGGTNGAATAVAAEYFRNSRRLISDVLSARQPLPLCPNAHPDFRRIAVSQQTTFRANNGSHHCRSDLSIEGQLVDCHVTAFSVPVSWP